MRILGLLQRLFAAISLISTVAWLVALMVSQHHEALTFWLVLALGSATLTFCGMWLDERALVRRLRSPDPFEAFLQRQLDEADRIERQRGTMGDEWFVRVVGKWDTANVVALGMGHPLPRGMRGPDGSPFAPQLVDGYRRNPETGTIGIPPPGGPAQYEAEFRRQRQWLRRTLNGIRGPGLIARMRDAVRKRTQTG